MVTILKAIGREEVEPSIVTEMLDMSSNTEFSYTLEAAENLLLYDVEFDDIKFENNHSGVSYIQKNMAIMFQETKSRRSILNQIKDGFDERTSGNKLNIKKQEMCKPIKKVKKN